MNDGLMVRLRLPVLAFSMFVGWSLTVAVMPAQAEPVCPRLMITGHPAYPPVAWAAAGKIVGAAPALVSEIASSLGVKDVVSKNYGSWEGAQEAVRSGEADVIFGIYKNDERAAYLDYVEPPFMTDPVAIVVRKGAGFGFAEWQDLKGRKGVTNAGESYGDKFDAFMAKELTVARPAGVDKVFAALLAGKADYMIIGLYPGRNEAKRLEHRRQARVFAQGAAVVGNVCSLLQTLQMHGVAGGLCPGHRNRRRQRHGSRLAGGRGEDAGAVGRQCVSGGAARIAHRRASYVTRSRNSGCFSR